MVTHPKRLVFAGAFVAALAVTSYLPRLVQDALHRNHSLSDGYDDSGSVGSTPEAAPASGTVSKELRPDTSPARILQAVRDSLQRNDLQSAEVLLRAARALDINNPQALALQHELDARETDSPAPPVPARSGIAPQRAEPRSVLRTSRTVDRTAQKRERVQSAPHRARETANIHASATVAKNVPVEAVKPVPEANEKPKFVADVVPETVPVPAPAPAIALPPVVQHAERPAPAPVVQSSLGPKSREQVRAELARARTDGSLPRFGNPDSAGPGVETISKPLAATLNR